MSRAIVVTVGVSLIQDHVEEREGLRVGFEALPPPAGNLRQLDEELKWADERYRSGAWDPEEEAWGRIRLRMVAALGRIAGDARLTPLQRQQYLGAELASLRCLGCEPRGDAGAAEGAARPAWERPLAADDEVVLLASDTAAGVFCAGVIQAVLQGGHAGFPAVPQTHVRMARGLRPDSRELFLAAGLPNAAQILFDVHRAHPDEMVLVASGGYKGLLPYLTPVAMDLGVPLTYLYEESSELLTIRPLPLKLDLRAVKANAGAFAKLAPIPGHERRPACPERQFWLPIRREHPEHEAAIRDRGWVERADTPGEVRLSATGVLAWLLAYHGYQPEQPVHSGPVTLAAAGRGADEGRKVQGGR